VLFFVVSFFRLRSAPIASSGPRMNYCHRFSENGSAFHSFENFLFDFLFFSMKFYDSTPIALTPGVVFLRATYQRLETSDLGPGRRLAEVPVSPQVLRQFSYFFLVIRDELSSYDHGRIGGALFFSVPFVSSLLSR